MKRFVVLISVLSILATMLIPVSAAEYNDVSVPYFNVLDYCTPNNNLDYNVNVNNGDVVSFDIPNNQYFSYVDIIFSTQGSAISSILLNDQRLTVYDYGRGLRHAYGVITSQRYSEFLLTFNTYGMCRLNFLKFDAVPLTHTPRHIIGTLNYEYNGSTSETLTMSAAQSPVSKTFNALSNPNSGKDFVDAKFRLHSSDWLNYDYLTYHFSTSFNISSISVYGANGAIPFTTSLFQVGSDQGDYVDKLIEVTIDLTSYDRSSDSAPVIEIRADQDKTKSAHFELRDVVGILNINYPDPIIYFLRRLSTNLGDWFTDLDTSVNTFMDNVEVWFDKLAASITGVFEYDTTESEEDKEALEDQSSEIDEINDQMDEVTKPVLDDINMDLGDDVGGNDILAGAAPFDSIFDSSIFLPMITISLTLAMASYVLFGKR